MERLLAILLFFTLLLPLAGTAQGADAGLPACCRRAGMHHCLGMNMPGMGGTASASHTVPQDPAWQAPVPHCPYCPATVAPGAHVDRLTLPGAPLRLLVASAHPAGVVQTESRGRQARDRARGKRGPPSPSLA